MYNTPYMEKRKEAKRGHGQSTKRRNCLGKTSRSFHQGRPKALGTFGSESLLENPRALGIARCRRPAIAWRYVQWRILRVQAQGAWNAGPGPPDQDFHSDRDLQSPKHPLQQEARRPLDAIAE